MKQQSVVQVALDQRACKNLKWCVTQSPVPYKDAVLHMETYVEKVLTGAAPPLVWLLTHPHVYTLGTSAESRDIISNPLDIPIVQTGRGGRVTYHGPGQRVVYTVCPIMQVGGSLTSYLRFIGEWIVGALHQIGIASAFDPDRIGVWCSTPSGQKKVGFVGIRIRKGIAFHGFSLNISSNLSFFKNIQPCGLRGDQVTTLEHVMGNHVSQASVDKALLSYLQRKGLGRSKAPIQPDFLGDAFP